MPWLEQSTVELHRPFVQDVRRETSPVSELCAAYGISRTTGYTWLARLEACRNLRP